MLPFSQMTEILKKIYENFTSLFEITKKFGTPGKIYMFQNIQISRSKFQVLGVLNQTRLNVDPTWSKHGPKIAPKNITPRKGSLDQVESVLQI